MRTFETSKENKFTTECRTFCQRGEIERMKLVVPPGKDIPVRWADTNNGRVMVIGDCPYPERVPFNSVDRMVSAGPPYYEVRRFTAQHDKQRMMTVIPSFGVPEFSALAKSELVPDVGLVVRIGMVANPGYVPPKPQEWEGKTIDQLVSMCGKAGIPVTAEMNGAIMTQMLRAHHLKNEAIKTQKDRKIPVPV